LRTKTAPGAAIVQRTREEKKSGLGRDFGALRRTLKSRLGLFHFQQSRRINNSHIASCEFDADENAV
jgi:hypothetical protein